jgi:hypothetical protein
VKIRLGWDPFTLPPEIEVEGAAHRTPKGFHAGLSFRNADGSSLGNRELESRDTDCRSLGEAVAVAITVAIDPDSMGTRLPLPEETPPETTAEAAASVRVQRETTPRVRATLNGGATAGLLPTITATTSLRVGIMLGTLFEVGVGAGYFPESRRASYGFGLVTGEARGCVLPWQAGGLLRFCGAALLGAFEVYSHSDELRPRDVGVFPWLGAEVGPVLSVPVFGPLRGELGVSAIVPLLRRQGFIGGRSEPVWEQARVTGRAELGLGMLF